MILWNIVSYKLRKDFKNPCIILEANSNVFTLHFIDSSDPHIMVRLSTNVWIEYIN